MSKVDNLLRVMKKEVWYRERDLRDMLPKEDRPHSALSSRLYYCLLCGYLTRRNRTKRNYEYKKVI